MNDPERRPAIIPATKAEVAMLLSALCDETISAEEMSRLDLLLVHDAECRRAYREMIALHVALQFKYHSSTDSPIAKLAEDDAAEQNSAGRGSAVTPSEAPIMRTGPVYFGSALVVSITTVVILVFAGIAWRWPGVGTSRQTHQLHRDTADGVAGTASAKSPAGGAPASSAAFARLAFNDGCRWGKCDFSPLPGMALDRGKTLELLEGAATVRYANGICLLLEGPARLTLVSSTKAKLDHGKCVAKVPPPNRGFRLSTPFAEVIDQGTEFGVMASEKGFSDVGVFKGKVECFAMDKTGACVDRAQLIEGQAARVDAKAVQSLTDLDALSESFPKVANCPFRHPRLLAVRGRAPGPDGRWPGDTNQRHQRQFRQLQSPRLLARRPFGRGALSEQQRRTAGRHVSARLRWRPAFL